MLDVAREMFLAEGFALTSMAAIAARIGGSKATLYNYFPSKHDLFATVIQQDCDRHQADLFNSLQMVGETVEAVLQTVGRRYVAIVLSDEVVQLNRVVIAEATRFPEFARLLYDSGPRRGRLRIGDWIQGQMNFGRLREEDAFTAADQFCNLCLGGFFQQRLMNLCPAPEGREIGSAVDAAADIFLAAYAPRVGTLSRAP